MLLFSENIFKFNELMPPPIDGLAKKLKCIIAILKLDVRALFALHKACAK